MDNFTSACDFQVSIKYLSSKEILFFRKCLMKLTENAMEKFIAGITTFQINKILKTYSMFNTYMHDVWSMKRDFILGEQWPGLIIKYNK